MTEQPEDSLEERVKNIENFLVFGIIMVVSFVYITEERYTAALVNQGLIGEIVLLLLMLIMFLSYLSCMFHMISVIESSAISTRVEAVKWITSFIEKNKSWLSYPTTGILLIIISVSVESFPGIEWEHVVIALFGVGVSIVLLKIHPKLDTSYKGFKSKK